jgi:hypothetical protein
MFIIGGEDKQDPLINEVIASIVLIYLPLMSLLA